MNVARPQLSQDLAELVARAQANFAALSPSQQLRHRYMQRRSFALSFGGDRVKAYQRMPHEATLSDAQIRLILEGAT